MIRSLQPFFFFLTLAFVGVRRVSPGDSVTKKKKESSLTVGEFFFHLDHRPRPSKAIREKVPTTVVSARADRRLRER